MGKKQPSTKPSNPPKKPPVPITFKHTVEAQGEVFLVIYSGAVNRFDPSKVLIGVPVEKHHKAWTDKAMPEYNFPERHHPAYTDFQLPILYDDRTNPGANPVLGGPTFKTLGEALDFKDQLQAKLDEMSKERLSDD